MRGARREVAPCGHLAECHAAARAGRPRRERRGRPRERRARRARRSRRVTETVRRTRRGIRARRPRAPRLFACSRVRFWSRARAPRVPNRASPPRWYLDPRRRRGGVRNAERARRRGAVAPRPRARRARRHRPPRQTERRVEVVGLDATPRFCLRGPANADVVDDIDDIGLVFLLFRVRIRHRQSSKRFRSTRDVRPDPRVGFPGRRAFQPRAKRRGFLADAP